MLKLLASRDGDVAINVYTNAAEVADLMMKVSACECNT